MTTGRSQKNPRALSSRASRTRRTRNGRSLELAQRDPELAAWFEQQCAVFDAIRGKLKADPACPQDLRRQIIVEHVAGTRVLPLDQPAVARRPPSPPWRC